MFKDTVVLVTGAASGIGLAVSQLFIQEHATVVGADIDEAALDAARSALGTAFVPRLCDVAVEAQVAGTAQFLDTEFGKLDVLVNNAGRGRLVNLETMEEADFEWHYAVLVKGPMLMVKHMVPLLRKSTHPSIVNVSSQAARAELMSNHFMYSTAKAALLKFTRHLVRDLPGIRANTVLPGWVDTPIYKRAGLDDSVIKAIYDAALPRIPAQRIGTPEDVANCILFLSSDKAFYINGATIDIDGGWGCNADWGGDPSQS